MNRKLSSAVKLAAAVAITALGLRAEGQHRLGGPTIDGSVVRVRGCGTHFIIAYHNDYALAEWLGGEMVRENDVLESTDPQASFEREGRMTLMNRVTGHTIDIMIEKALMNRSDFSQTVDRVCR